MTAGSESGSAGRPLARRGVTLTVQPAALGFLPACGSARPPCGVSKFGRNWKLIRLGDCGMFPPSATPSVGVILGLRASDSEVPWAPGPIQLSLRCARRRRGPSGAPAAAAGGRLVTWGK